VQVRAQLEHPAIARRQRGGLLREHELGELQVVARDRTPLRPRSLIGSSRSLQQACGDTVPDTRGESRAHPLGALAIDETIVAYVGGILDALAVHRLDAHIDLGAGSAG
jgi:hypothetical protein